MYSHIIKPLLTLLILAMSITLLGCSDKKAVNKSNFKEAIDKYVQSNMYCQRIGSDPFPLELVKKDYGYEGNELKLYESLGLISKRKDEFERDISNPEYKWNSVDIPRTIKAMVPGMRYELTDLGKKYYRYDKDDFRGMGTSQLCFAQCEVEEIKQFTEPVQMGNVMASQVSFTYRTTKMANWAKNDALLELYPLMQEALNAIERPATGRCGVVLTNDGWVHEQAARELLRLF